MLLSLLFALATAAEDPSLFALVTVESSLLSVQRLHDDALRDEDVPAMLCAVPRERELERLRVRVEQLGAARPSGSQAVEAWRDQLDQAGASAERVLAETQRCFEALLVPPGDTVLSVDCGDQVCREPRERRSRAARRGKRQG